MKIAALNNTYKALVIGVSAGGFQALKHILPRFPKNFPLSVIIVQHRGEAVQETSSKDDFLIHHFQQHCQMTVKEAISGEKICKSTIYFAPAKYHLLIEKEESFSLSLEPPVNFSIPSIDVLFESASACYKNCLIGLILTGANSDGSMGLREIHLNNGLTLVQNPATADVDVMPKAAMESHTVDYILPLLEIAPFLCDLMQEEKG
ncbi:chemotaxis protein CheB [Colwellia sp. 75C3]|uniref:chemotaxis protein CheB n=1 Tax=Colwellia sp. 75C3 TaxID=888425 RepID=UPI000C342429|nr:chemotaxis protein CheB [Colwellia sp. 75C3]PKG82475.1 chemotaxis protein CheB [Colwellia sp. 75C3]